MTICNEMTAFYDKISFFFLAKRRTFAADYFKV